MKKNFIFSTLAVACLGLTLTSCNPADNPYTPEPRDISWSGMDVSITVPVVNDLSAHENIGSGTFSYNLDSFISLKSGGLLGLKNVESFRISSCKLTIQNSDATNNFANFESASASFSTSLNTAAVTIGKTENNPDVTASELQLPITNTDNLKSYLPPTGPVTINYNLGGKMRRVTTKELTIIAHIEYDLHVK